ncbi:hypothetical protein ACJ72_04027 [Emergomyces africanus]|uniref:Protein kinase domain-containing protein n=1 Tax=Emergomyces africanus TaxID=1955775 RepID=A0A1B7NXW7_9EURO|nr:hypothetical protein ACJ72_04027 [Emergomyces africanus]
MDFTDIDPSEVTFKRNLFSSEFSEIFLVDIRNKTCVMKVHHDNGPVKHASRDRETNIHICESAAYRRLMEHGLGDRGIVPQFYGTIEQMDLSRYQPHLNMFLEDKNPPSAILLEYIQNMEMLYPHNFTKELGEAFIRGIREIHSALVQHCDAKPRNMMIVRGDRERVVWLDFDRAQTYHAESLTERQRGFIEEEEIIVSQLADLLQRTKEIRKDEDEREKQDQAQDHEQQRDGKASEAETLYRCAVCKQVREYAKRGRCGDAEGV